MYYFVIGADGNRYGPADIDTLVEWTREGRIVASSRLIERGTDKELPAENITAIAAELSRSGASATISPGVVVERDETPRSGETQTLTRMPGTPPPDGPQGKITPPTAPIAHYASQPRVIRKNRVIAGLLGIFLGGLGAHRFYLGYTGTGILMLLLTIFFGGCGGIVIPLPGLGCGIVGLWGMIEGIICLCGGMRDADGHELAS